MTTTAVRSDRCEYKRQYPDWLTAEREALRLMADLDAGLLPRKKGGTVFAYPCGDHYHIGHEPLPRTPFLDGCIPSPHFHARRRR